MGKGESVEFENIVYEKEDHIATLTLNRPDRGNALSRRLRDELDLVLDDLDRDDDTRVLLIKANGQHFCTGYDLDEYGYLWSPEVWDEETASREEDTREYRRSAIWSRREFHLSRERWMRLWRIRQATVACVHGNCVAGGNDLIGVTDIVFAADNARIGQPEARTMGEIHMFGMWPVHLGMRKTKEWLMTGDYMTGEEAAEHGLVNHAVPADELEAVARSFAERISKVSLEMLYSHKEAINRWWDTMGITSAIAAANDLDAMGIAGPGSAEFGRVQYESGTRAAVEARDAPFEYRNFWEEYRASRGKSDGE